MFKKKNRINSIDKKMTSILYILKKCFREMENIVLLNGYDSRIAFIGSFHYILQYDLIFLLRILRVRKNFFQIP